MTPPPRGDLRGAMRTAYRIYNKSARCILFWDDYLCSWEHGSVYPAQKAVMRKG